MTKSGVTLAQRREALLVQCALQRVEAARELHQLRSPDAPGGGILGGVNVKVPLTIASVVIGMIATRSGKALPMLTAGLSLFKMARTAMTLLRRRPAPDAAG